jgi:transposase
VNARTFKGRFFRRIRVSGLQRSRYLGAAKKLLQHVLAATAINLARIGNSLMDPPVVKIRTSAFEKLMRQPAPC